MILVVRVDRGSGDSGRMWIRTARAQADARPTDFFSGLLAYSVVTGRGGQDGRNGDGNRQMGAPAIEQGAVRLLNKPVAERERARLARSLVRPVLAA